MAKDLKMYAIDGFDPLRVFGGDAARQRAETYVIQQAHGACVELLDDLTDDERIVVRAQMDLDEWNRNRGDGCVYTHAVVRRGAERAE